MLEKAMDLLNVDPHGIYVDGTLGGGGHSLAIANLLAPDGCLIALDQDEEALLFSRNRLPRDRNVVAFRDNFEFFDRRLQELQIEMIDGMLLDLGVSSHQIDIPNRGFSYQDDASPLIMNMGMADSNARDILNRYEKSELVRVFRNYGELRFPQRLAQAVIDYRRLQPLMTAGDLKNALMRYIPPQERIKEFSKLFQAIRIEVNQELRHLEQVLPKIATHLKPGGRMVIISYHSLEDRVVKEFFRLESRDCICPETWPTCQCHHHASLRVLTRKPLEPAPDEIMINPRSRSARMRAAERIGG